MTGTPQPGCPDVVTFGEAMGALRARTPVRLGGTLGLSVAGAEANVAIGLARLGHTVSWVGRVGDDEFGALVLRTLRAEAVDIRHTAIDRDGRPTGLLAAERRIRDLARVTYWRAGSAGSAIGPADVLPALRAGTRILHLTGITPALGPSAADATLAAAQQARALGVTVCLDVNYRARLWSADQARSTLLPLSRLADIIVASTDELHLVCDDPTLPEHDATAALLRQGRREIVLTRGGDGAAVISQDGSITAPARPVPVVDTLGAGDAFVAGYLSGLLNGLDARQRLERATITGAFAVSTPGDWEGLPTREDLPLLDQPAGTALR
ncbi:sugar kinase [Streptomyces tubercidicus]|uniref:sugar kinase n=1 Tax=Streptomyces tubercidicus TaxID=47759 RepID=UPI003688BE1E